MTPWIRIVASALVAVALTAARPTSADTREDLALELMRLTGETNAGATAAAGIVAQMKPAFPTVSDEEWKEIESTVETRELIDLSVSVYVKHFDESELSQLVDFYRSSLGRKLLERTPRVLNEIAVKGNRWAQAQMDAISTKLQSRGHPIRNRE